MTNQFILRVALALLCFLLEGCATARDAKRNADSDAAANRNLSTQYKLRPGDFLLITFSGEPDYTQQVRVDWNGEINLPSLSGSGRSTLQAADLSTGQLAENINSFAHRNQILQNARAQVVVVEFANQTFVLLGQVAQPGRYAFPKGVAPVIDLKDAIALGGGYTRLARQSLIVVKRGDQVYKVDLRKLATRPGQGRFTIIPNDTITVAERLF